MNLLRSFCLVVLLAPFTLAAEPGEANTNQLAELDALWAEVSRTVNEGDFAGYSATCHPEGVLVAGTSGKSFPLSKALSNWQHEFDDTKAGKMKASVTFRFSQRLNDATTAHEEGMFLYTQHKEGAEPRMEYIHFEALLLKRPDGWKVMMEYQKSRGTKAEWDALK